MTSNYDLCSNYILKDTCKSTHLTLSALCIKLNMLMHDTVFKYSPFQNYFCSFSGWGRISEKCSPFLILFAPKHSFPICFSSGAIVISFAQKPRSVLGVHTFCMKLWSFKLLFPVPIIILPVSIPSCRGKWITGML